jgi:hypothetical protein
MPDHKTRQYLPKATFLSIVMRLLVASRLIVGLSHDIICIVIWAKCEIPR